MKILVSGAGIAGSAATLYLRARGHEVVTVDKAPAFRPLGYVLSLKYFGLAIVRELGVLEELERFGIPYTVLEIHDEKGALLQEYPAALAEQATRGSLFLLRSDLHGVLHAAAERLARVRFGTSISSLRCEADSASVTYASGDSERFDLVVIAEGLRSDTRRLLWGDEGVRPFDVIYAATMVDGRHGVPDRVYRIYLAHGASLLVLPVNEQRLMIQCYFRRTLEPESRGEQVHGLLREASRQFPQQLRDTIERIADTSYVFSNAVGMVSLASLHRERVVLLGDAGYCPTFLSGMGASLALLGAKALRLSLERHPDSLPAALAEYDRLMRPVIEHYQQNARDNVELILARNPLREIAEQWAIRLLPPAVVARRLGHQHDLEAGLLEDFGPLDR